MSERRVTEAELRPAILRALAKSATGFMTTSDLIAEMEHLFKPTGKDAETIYGRSDTYFSQKVRNATGSHVDRPPTGLAAQGYVTRDKEREGVTITDAGRAYLKTLGD